MPMGRLRDRQRVETRAVILEAALDLMETKGYEHTTVEDIAAASGVSSRTFFRYFESKADVLFDKHDSDADHDDKSQAMTAALANRPASESTIEALRAVLHDKLGELFDHDDGFKLRQLRVVLAEPSLRLLAREGFHEHGPQLAAAFAQRLHTTPDDLGPRVLAAAFQEAIWVILERWSASGGELDRLPVLIDEAFATMATGFR